MVDKPEDTPDADGQRDEPSSDIAAQPVIDAFGGIRPMAAKLGVPVSTVQGWKQRDTIPASRVGAIVAAGREHGVSLPEPTVKASAPPSEPEGEPAAKAATTPGERRPAGPRPGVQFSPRPPQPDAQQDEPTAAAGAAASARREPEHVPETSRSTPASVPTAAAAAGPGGAAPARSGGGALVLAIVALIVAVLWPILFSEWLGADAQDGGGAALGELEQRISALEEAPAGDAGTLQQAVDDLRAQVDGLSGGQGGASADAMQALTARLDALEQVAESGADGPAAVTQALDSLEQTISRLDQVVSGLQDRVTAIEDKVAQLEAGDGGQSVDDLRAALDSVRSAVDQIQANLDDISEAADSARQEAVSEASAMVDRAVARLNQQIAAVAGTDDPAAEHQAFLLALGQLSTRLRTADAFADELAALRQVVATSPSISPALGEAVDQAFAPVDAAAAEGIPTLAGLRASFDGMRLAVLNATGTPPEDTLDEVWGEISSMVTISRVDGADADTVDGILATAESHLAGGDLGGAVAALERLADVGGGYADAAAAWLADARLRLAADQAVEGVYQAALASFRPDPEAAGDDGAPAEPAATDAE